MLKKCGAGEKGKKLHMWFLNNMCADRKEKISAFPLPRASLVQDAFLWINCRLCAQLVYEVMHFLHALSCSQFRGIIL